MKNFNRSKRQNNIHQQTCARLRAGRVVLAAAAILMALGVGKSFWATNVLADSKRENDAASYLLTPGTPALGAAADYLSEMTPVKATEGIYTGRKELRPPSLKGVS